MYFLLSKREPEKGVNYWRQLGIVVAENANIAVGKIKLTEIERIERSEGEFPGTFISLKNDKAEEYQLDSLEEITGPLPE